MTIDEHLEKLQISIDNFKSSVDEYLASLKQEKSENMTYKITIKDQKTGEEIREEIETLKQLKWILLQYKNRQVDVEMKEIKKR